MPKSAICSQPIEMFLIFDMVRVGKTTHRKERVCMELIICDHDIVETLVIEKSVIDYCKGRNVQVLIRCCTNWQELTSAQRKASQSRHCSKGWRGWT